MPIHITGTGSYTPERVLTNADLEAMVDTSDEWIRTRTGIHQRHIKAEDQATSDLALEAAQAALDAAGVSAEELDVLLVATCTPDSPMPGSATIVQDKLGAKNAFAMDLNAACSGFLYALECARGLLESGRHRKALVIGAESMSSIVNWEDRTTCILFGDGAGAAVVEYRETPGGLGLASLGANGALKELLNIPAGGSREPLSEEALQDHRNCIKMSGQEVFKHAVSHMTRTAKQLLAEADWQADELALVIPHQANQRILEAIRSRVGVEKDKVFVNVDRTGNTSAASVGIALDEAVRSGRLQPGDKVMLLAFGAGFTWGGFLLEWSKA